MKMLAQTLVSKGTDPVTPAKIPTDKNTAAPLTECDRFSDTGFILISYKEITSAVHSLDKADFRFLFQKPLKLGIVFQLDRVMLTHPEYPFSFYCLIWGG